MKNERSQRKTMLDVDVDADEGADADADWMRMRMWQGTRAEVHALAAPEI